MLKGIHTGHYGINKCVQRASALFWPQMYEDIEKYVKECSYCQKFARSNVKEPLILPQIQKLPWYQVGMDLYELYGEWYIILVDYYSKYVEIRSLNKNLSTKNVIQKMKSIFSKHGSLPL